MYTPIKHYTYPPQRVPDPIFHTDFDGHGKRSFDNIHAYAYVYGQGCALIFGSLPHAASNDFYAEGYRGNKCVLATAAPYLSLGDGCVADGTLANRMLLGNNTVYVPGGSGATINCGKTYTFEQWQALGLDGGTAIADVPPASVIIGWARDMLGL